MKRGKRMNIKITKKEKLLSVSNSWIAADYWLIHGRIYNTDNTAFYRFKFVLTIDRACDLWDEETETERDYMETLQEMAWCFLDCLSGEFNENIIHGFIDECNETIRAFCKMS
jgi:hypothetical protein